MPLEFVSLNVFTEFPKEVSPKSLLPIPGEGSPPSEREAGPTSAPDSAHAAMREEDK